jgi:hypothetical protein
VASSYGRENGTRGETESTHPKTIPPTIPCEFPLERFQHVSFGKTCKSPVKALQTPEAVT